MKKMLDEVQDSAFWGDPQARIQPIGLLFSDGSIPAVNPAVLAVDPTAANWGRPLNLGAVAGNGYLLGVDDAACILSGGGPF